MTTPDHGQLVFREGPQDKPEDTALLVDVTALGPFRLGYRLDFCNNAGEEPFQ